MSWRNIKKWPVTPQHIVALAKNYTPTCGVYFLILGNDVVYVGQSVNVHGRVAEHRNNGVDFDRWHFIECEREWLNDLEAAFIWQFYPRLNKTHNSGNRAAKEASLRIQIEVDRWHNGGAWEAMVNEWATPNAQGKPTAANELNEG